MSKLTGYGAPTDETIGAVGDIYTNTSTGVEYECVAIHEIKTDEVLRYYVWVRVNAGGSGSGEGSSSAYPGDEYINSLIDVKLGVIENGTY